MSKDNFWIGVGAGLLGAGLVAYALWKLHDESYKRGWNGESLKSQGFLGIFGWTTSGALVVIPSFNNGKYDRELELTVTTQASRMSSLDGLARNVKEQLNRVEQETKKQHGVEISVEERDFLKELHDMVKKMEEQPQPKLVARQRKMYT